MNDKLNLSISLDDFYEVVERIRLTSAKPHSLKIIVTLRNCLNEDDRRKFLDYYRKRLEEND